MHDLRYALRVLLHAPGMSTLAVVTLALGIGMTSAIFSLINATLLTPLPGIGDPGRVVTIGRVLDGQGFDNSSYPNYLDLREQNRVFSHVAAVRPATLSVGTGSRAVRVAGAMVTPNYFAALAVPFARGGPLPDTGDPAGHGSTALVISYAMWVQQLGMDPEVIGRTMSVNGQPFQVAGVTAPAFRGSDPSVQLDAWLPLASVRTMPGTRALFRDIDWFQHREGVWLMLYARLAPAVSHAQAITDVQGIADRLRQYPENARNGWAVIPGVGLDPDGRQQVSRLAGLLFAAVVVLFVLACSNVATLTLSRVTARSREVAVRIAVGASRWCVVRQLLTESLVLALIGGAAGLLVSAWAALAMSSLLAGSARLPLVLDLSPDTRVLGFTFGLSCLAGVLVGLVPALQSARTGVMGALKESVGALRRPSGLRRGLVVMQLAISTILLVGAGLLLRSVRSFNAIDTGFDASGLVLLTIEPSTTGNYDSDADLRQFYDSLLTSLRGIPGVEAATLARMAPVTPRGYGVFARILDKPGSTAETNGLQFNTVASDYFDVMRIPILRGRAFRAGDTVSSPLVAVVNEVAARRFWPDEDALGKQIWVGGDPAPREIVGVASVVKYRDLVERPYPLAYYPISQPYPMPEAPAVLHVRTRLPLAVVAAAVERAVRAIDPDVPVFDVKSVSRHVADSYWQQRVLGIAVGILAALALTLGAVGLYGVMACATAERTRETGVRIALGAGTRDIIRLVTFDAGRLVAVGILLGLVLARAATGVISALLFGVTAGDPATYAGVVLLLAVVALIACSTPAIRATRVDPLVAMRQE